MSMILDAFVGNCVDKLIGMASEKVVMVLGVQDELRRLVRRLARLQKFLETAERRRLEEPDVKHWVSELRDVAYDADDIIDRCRLEGALLLVDQSSSSLKTWDKSPKYTCLATYPTSLRVVENLPNVMEQLMIINNQSLERVSHLPALQALVVINCPALNCVEKLDSLQRLDLIDMFLVRIPKWLERLLEERKTADDDDDFLFKFTCSDIAFSRLLKGGLDWPIIERIPQVFASDNVGGGFLRYTRNPKSYYTNIGI